MSLVEATTPPALDPSWVFCAEKPRPLDMVLPEKAPLAALPFSILSQNGECSVSSGHKVRRMIITQGADKEQIVYFKLCDSTYPPILAQIESALGASYRITRGDSVPRIKPVINPEGEVIGTASYELHEFESMAEQGFSAADMIHMGVAEELVARYVRMEDDLHPGNVGTSSKLGIVGIDFDMSLYPLTSVIKGPRFINNGIFAPLPADAFPITDADICNFPDIQDAQPCFWPTKFPNNSNWRKGFGNRDEFKKLKNEGDFIPRKYFAFLKELLIDTETHLKVMESSFSRDFEAKEMQEKIKDCIDKRWAVLEEVLVENEGFRKFIVQNKTVFQGCLDHFTTYNKEIAENNVEFHSKHLEERYHAVVRKCLVKDLTLAAYKLGSDLKSKGDNWSKYKVYYHQLIDVFTQLQKDPNSFPEALFTLDCERIRLVEQIGALNVPWGLLCSHIVKVISNYQGLVTIKQGEGALIQSMLVPPVPAESGALEQKKLDKEASLAKALYKMLSDSHNNKKILAIAKACLDEYKPVGYETTVGSFNPLSYFRTRVPRLEALIKELQEPIGDGRTIEHISDFFSAGAWNTRGYLRGASANVLLISKLCESILEGFKNQITLEQLRNHDLVEVCYAREGGCWDIESSAQKIAQKLVKLIQSKVRASQL